MARTKVRTGSAAPSYAGFWIRFIASVIDSVIISIFFFIASMLIMFLQVPLWQQFLLYGAIILILDAIYEITLTAAYGGTFGKLLVRVRVQDETGSNLSVGQSIGRYFAKYLSMIPIFLGYLWVAFEGRKRGWHDMLAGSLVINDPKSNVSPTVRTVAIILTIIGIVGYVLIMLLIAVVAFFGILNQTQFELDESNPVLSIKEHCDEQISKEFCITFSVMSHDDELSPKDAAAACGLIERPYDAGRCMARYARERYDDTLCGYLDDEEAAKQCQNEVSLFVSMAKKGDTASD